MSNQTIPADVMPPAPVKHRIEGWEASVTDLARAEVDSIHAAWINGGRQSVLDEIAAADGPVAAARMQAALDDQDGFDTWYPAVTPPCPPWCTDRPGHAYDDADEDWVYARFHTYDPNHSTHWVTQREFNADGVVTYGPVTVESGDRIEHEFTPSELREIAGALLDVATKLEELQRQS